MHGGHFEWGRKAKGGRAYRCLYSVNCEWRSSDGPEWCLTTISWSEYWGCIWRCWMQLWCWTYALRDLTKINQAIGSSHFCRLKGQGPIRFIANFRRQIIQRTANYFAEIWLSVGKITLTLIEMSHLWLFVGFLCEIANWRDILLSR